MKMYVKNIYHVLVICLVVQSVYGGDYRYRDYRSYTLDDLERANEPVIPEASMTRQPKALTPANVLQPIEKQYQTFLEKIEPHLDGFKIFIAQPRSKVKPGEIKKRVDPILDYYKILLKELSRYPSAIVQDTLKKFTEYTLKQVENSIPKLNDIIWFLYQMNVRINTIERVKDLNKNLANILYQAKGEEVMVADNPPEPTVGFAGLGDYIELSSIKKKSLSDIIISPEDNSQKAEKGQAPHAEDATTNVEQLPLAQKELSPQVTSLTEKAMNWLETQGNLSSEDKEMMQKKISRLVQKKQEAAGLGVALQLKESALNVPTGPAPDIKKDPVSVKAEEALRPLSSPQEIRPLSETIVVKKLYDLENALIRLKHQLRVPQY